MTVKAISLLPNKDSHGEYYIDEYTDKLLCLQLADNDLKTANYYYKELDELELWDFIACRKALEYEQQSQLDT